MSLILKLSGVCSEGHFTVFQKIKWCRAKNIGSGARTILLIVELTETELLLSFTGDDVTLIVRFERCWGRGQRATRGGSLTETELLLSSTTDDITLIMRMERRWDRGQRARRRRTAENIRRQRTLAIRLRPFESEPYCSPLQMPFFSVLKLSPYRAVAFSGPHCSLFGHISFGRSFSFQFVPQLVGSEKGRKLTPQ